jgi:tRNA-splicing ligase RtcB (3'-phosphate/5'-hydroxy nucleic acid ligase)
MTESQAFSQLVKNSHLDGKQRNAAWALFKAKGYAEAAAFVQKIEDAIPPAPEPLTLRSAPLPYRTWGKDLIDESSFEQMNAAMSLPVSVAGALMPDAHKGYGLPIGGVLAVDSAVIPYAVGVDIACRMMLSVFPVEADVLDKDEKPLLQNALVDNTTFGAGGAGLHSGKYDHPLLDQSNWQATSLLRSLRETAIHQIGTSGTGNHFVEWGALTILPSDFSPLSMSVRNGRPTEVPAPEGSPGGMAEGSGEGFLNLKPGKYLALLSHSGSRGVGYKIAEHYSTLAMWQMPGLPESVKHLAWLMLDSEAGQEYWHAMHLAGEFASANHHIIHEQVAKAAGLTPVAAIENHHNFAWKEMVKIDGRKQEAIVHRKGATPAGNGVLGIIPGTMADEGYVVSGKGEPQSLNSASHGGGRIMSRNQAKKTINPRDQQKMLKERGIKLIGGGLDEAPQAYKQIAQVIQAQSDLVDIIGKFQPRLVRMATDEPLWKRKPAPSGIVDQEGD